MQGTVLPAAPDAHSDTALPPPRAPLTTEPRPAQNCRASADAVAAALGIPADQVLIESTGVIGRQLKMEALLEGVPELAKTLESTAEGAHHAAVAITTTDLVSKSAALEVGETAFGKALSL